MARAAARDTASFAPNGLSTLTLGAGAAEAEGPVAWEAGGACGCVCVCFGLAPVFCVGAYGVCLMHMI